MWEVWGRMWECGERSGNARLREDEDAPLLLAQLGQQLVHQHHLPRARHQLLAERRLLGRARVDARLRQNLRVSRVMEMGVWEVARACARICASAPSMRKGWLQHLRSSITTFISDGAAARPSIVRKATLRS